MDPPEIIDGGVSDDAPSKDGEGGEDGELERINSELARAWDASLRERALRARSESIASMVAGIAHDVNTPLGVARTAGSAIADVVRDLLEDPPEDPDEIEEMRGDLHDALELLNRNLDRAQKLIVSFKHLSASQLSNERATVKINQIITDCVIVMRSDLERAKIRMQLNLRDGDNYDWNGFPGHLGQVIVNLLQNAMRYAFEGRDEGHITIDLVRQEQEKGGGFLIRFADDGNGVDSEILPRIFDPMVTSGQGKGGTGLGLAISRNIVVNLLGGTIRCESEKGKGTVFTMTLPEVATGDSERYLHGLSTGPPL
jgi:signal transduction histidine kinase